MRRKIVGIVSIRDPRAAVKSDPESDGKQHEAFILGTGYGSGRPRRAPLLTLGRRRLWCAHFWALHERDAMPLPPPAERNLLHTRRFHFAGYQRSDGLWDIDGHMTDAKSYSFPNAFRGSVEADEALHDMSIGLGDWAHNSQSF